MSLIICSCLGLLCAGCRLPRDTCVCCGSPGCSGGAQMFPLPLPYPVTWECWGHLRVLEVTYRTGECWEMMESHMGSSAEWILGTFCETGGKLGYD